MALKSVIEWLITPALNSSTGEKSVAGRVPGPKQAGSGAVNILVCDFDGPEGRQVAQRISGIFAGKPRIYVHHMPRKLKLSGRGSLVEQLLGAAETGRKWLLGSTCDVLLWGTVTEPERGITVRFLCATADAVKLPGSFGLGDTLELAPDYDTNLEKLIFTATIAAVAPRKPEQARQELTEILEEGAQILSPFIDAPPSDFGKKQFSSFMSCLGTVFAALWRVSDDGARLDRAIKAYRVVLSQEHDTDDPLGLALTQNHMAVALQALSRRDHTPEPLKLAAECYRSVAATLGAQSHPNDWALAHIHLGDVLVELANFTDRETYLKGASVAYQNALKIFTRQAMPGPWAELMNQLGVTLMGLSETMEGSRLLDQAATCFRQALEVRRRDVAPLLWAQTANNLGAVTFSIYKQSHNSGLLSEAALCFEGAADVYAHHGRPDIARVAKNNLERIRQLQQK